MVLKSNFENIAAVELLIEKLKGKYDVSEECWDDIWLTLNEALSNAIKHGNKFDPQKKVNLSVQKKDDRYLCFTIKDEGDGFNLKAVADPLDLDKIDEPNGRGVFLINQLADKVKYLNNGSTLEMCFDLVKNKK